MKQLHRGGKAKCIVLKGLEFENYKLGSKLNLKNTQSLSDAIKVFDAIEENDRTNKIKMLKLVDYIDASDTSNIKRIYNWYLEGYGTQHIAFMLNEKGIQNPTKYKQEAGLNFKNSNMNNDFGLWNKTTVKRIIKNELYIGTMVQGKRKKVSYKSKKIISTSKDEWFRKENTHEPIIEKSIFYEAQRRINQRQRSTGDGQAHIFATKVRCADCGNIMSKVTAFRYGERLYSYLRCKIYAAAGNKSLCTSHAIRLDYLQDIVTAKLREYINIFLDEASVASILQSSQEMDGKKKSLESQIVNIEKSIKQNSLVLKNLYLDKVNGIITNEQFYDLSKNFSDENISLDKRKEDIKIAISQLIENTNNTISWINIVRQYVNFEELTHLMVSQFVDFIEVEEKDKKTGDQIVKIHWCF